MIDINLLPEKNVSTIEENRVKKFSLLGFVGFSAVWALVLGGLFFYSSILAGQQSSLSLQKDSLQSRLNEQSSLVNDLLNLKQKASGISYIQKNRFDLPASLKYIFSLFPPEIAVSKITIDNLGFVTMDLRGTDSEIVADFVSSMGEETVLKSPTLSTFNLSSDNKYNFVITAQYGDKIVKSINN